MKQQRPTASERLIERLRAAGVEIPIGSVVERTYAGVHQRNAGAWSWFIDCGPGRKQVGSQFPVTQLLCFDKLEVTEGDYGIDVDPPRSGTAAPTTITR